MAKISKNEMKKLIKNRISEMVGSELLVKYVGNINMKHINNLLSSNTYSLETVLFCVDYVSSKYYAWEVDISETKPSDNCGRLVYLLNESIEIADFILKKSDKQEETFKDEGMKTNVAKDLFDYKDLAKKIGL